MNDFRRQLTVLWMIWAYLLGGAVLIQWFLGGGLPTETTEGEPPAVFILICIANLAISVIARWFVLPRVRGYQVVLPVMILGLAFAEAPLFFQIFLLQGYPTTQIVILVATFAAHLQWMPLNFANLLAESPREARDRWDA